MEPAVTDPLDDASLFSSLTSNAKEVKSVEGFVPFNENLRTIDLGLKARVFDEDKTYAGSKFYRQNIRRGTAYLRESDGSISLLRRGLQKFFDLRDEYLKVLDGTIPVDAMKVSKVEKEFYHVIFDDVVNLLQEGGKVLVHKSEKANGENAQISYCKRHNAWVIASKNVTILVKDEADVEEYAKVATLDTEQKTMRYTVAVLIARAWFKLLRTLVKDPDELKKDMEGKTLIGEFCGHPHYQHLVEYSEITILFYAAVSYHGDRTCGPVGATNALLAKHGLPRVKVEVKAQCDNVKELIETLQVLFREVAKSPVEMDGEGSVLYFEGILKDRTELGSNMVVLSLCKVKTLEYRLFRKLREKLKSLIAKKKRTDYAELGVEEVVELVLKKYKKEAGQLAEGYEMSRPMEYYLEVAELALNFVARNKELVTQMKLSNHFLDALKVFKKKYEERVALRPEDFEHILAMKDDGSGDEDDEEVE